MLCLNTVILIFLLLFLSTCEPDKCLIKKKHYLDLLNPEYNIAKDPTAPMSGRKHSDETRKNMSDAQNSGHFKPGEDHPMFGQNHSDETTLRVKKKKHIGC